MAQKLGQLQPFIHVIPQECVGQLAAFGANLTPFSLQSTAGDTTVVFFLSGVLLGSYFMMNMFVAGLCRQGGQGVFDPLGGLPRPP